MAKTSHRHSSPASSEPRAGITPVERLTRPLRAFAEHQLAGALTLLGATLLAMAWANSPWAGSYRDLLQLPISVSLGGLLELDKPLLLWINDGLMGIFFFVVGLEIKRELRAGELSTLRKAVLPVSAALGGMLLPAGIFLIFNLGGPGKSGWGIPMATDIAFALGVLALLGDRVPLGLKVLLTALAIADDLGAILVIAVFYTESIAVTSLIVGGVLLGLATLANLGGVRSAWFYFLLGTLAWLAFLKSGVHATLAAVLMAFTIPARTRIDLPRFESKVQRLLAALRETFGPQTGSDHHDWRRQVLGNERQQSLLEEMSKDLQLVSTPLQRLEHALLPVTTFLVLPVFALANGGVTLGREAAASLGHPLGLGIIAGLLLGKQLGILGFSWIAVRLGLADLPDGVTWRHVHGIGVLGGIGFTMSLFIGGLAFTDPQLVEVAKVGTFVGSVLSGLLGYFLLSRTGRPTLPSGA